MTDPVETRFGVAAKAPQALETMLQRGSCRDYINDPLPRETLMTLAAAALASPTKSDLQQRDILFVEDADTRHWINGLLTSMPWVKSAPHFAIFLGNNRRQRQVHDWRDHDFANDHLDAFFNAAVDAAVALSAFVAAAERIDIGCCPISVIRNHAQAVSDRFALPDHVFPICGLTFGRPATPPPISPRLPLSHTVHWDRFREDGIDEAITAYDARRNTIHPLTSQRDTQRFGIADPYTWSEDKARQYAVPERQDFGAFIRSKGFCLD